jgi:hypothetical protein
MVAAEAKGFLIRPAAVLVAFGGEGAVSQPAVSPMSQSAARGNQGRVRATGGMRVWKPAIQQVWKPAVQQRGNVVSEKASSQNPQ